MSKSEAQAPIGTNSSVHELSREQLEDLRRHAKRSVRWFVAYYIYLLIVFGAHLLFELPGPVSNFLIATLFIVTIHGVISQFSKRCPNCGANLGWQARLGIPPNCKKCGVRLTEQKPSA